MHLLERVCGIPATFLSLLRSLVVFVIIRGLRPGLHSYAASRLTEDKRSPSQTGFSTLRHRLEVGEDAF
jgi:hypothetical protein